METRRSADMRLAQRSGVVGLALVVLSLALAIAARLVGGSVPWTAWALPALFLSGLLVTLFIPRERFPRATKVYYLVALVSALGIVTSLVLRLIHFAERAV